MTKQQIIDEIKSYETIIIHRHVRPDPDALGSQCGLKAMIEYTFPHKKVYVVGEEEPSLRFFAQMDTITDDVYEGALVIVCDTANTERISDKRYTKGDLLIKIDHHPNNEPYGDIVWVDTHASSTSEMIYELFEAGKLNGLQINDSFARFIYGGIVGDTGRFLFPSTTNKTFHYAAELIKFDFNRQELYDGLYKIDLPIARLRGYVLQHFSIDESGACSIRLTEETLAEYGVTSTDTGKLVGTIGDVESVKAWVFFIEEADIIRVRLRSKGPVINALAAKYNGGGHPLASGASVHSWEEADQLTEDLIEICQTYVDA